MLIDGLPTVVSCDPYLWEQLFLQFFIYILRYSSKDGIDIGIDSYFFILIYILINTHNTYLLFLYLVNVINMDHLSTTLPAVSFGTQSYIQSFNIDRKSSYPLFLIVNTVCFEHPKLNPDTY